MKELKNTFVFMCTSKHWATVMLRLRSSAGYWTWAGIWNVWSRTY